MSKGGSSTCWECSKSIENCECGKTTTWDDKIGPICPWCGHLNKASDSDGILYNESTTSYECGECCKEFKVRVHITFCWVGHRPKASDAGVESKIP